jgi:zinc protease
MPARFAAVVALLAVSLALTACASAGAGRKTAPTLPAPVLEVRTETYRLANGLNVVLHVDRSDPLIGVAVMYHVGSSCEAKGKTGFAHLFEHIMFQESEHVPQDTYFQKIQQAGGMLNGFTWQDGTMYFEVVPKNALEMALWMESDRMGFLLGALDETAFYNQQMVVMNEKRQWIDNEPYGWTSEIVASKLFGPDHPYGWEVIGAMSDLAQATVADARTFFARFYGPNNATLVLAGDLDVEQARRWVERYFGEIPAGPQTSKPAPQPAGFAESADLMVEDRLATVPEVSFVWPGAASFHEDEAPLEMLVGILADGKSAPLYRRLVEEKKLTASVEARNETMERAGAVWIVVRPHKGISLEQVRLEVEDVLAKFNAGEVTARRLARLKARFEVAFYKLLEGVMNKSLYLALYAVLAGDPDALATDVQRYLKVTPEDVMRVFDRYLKDRPRLTLSTVPKGATALAVKGAAAVVLPDDGGLAPKPPGTPSPKTSTPSSFDRNVQPPSGAVPPVPAARTWAHGFADGLKVLGTTSEELPLVQFGLDLRGGHVDDPPERPGLAWVTASLLDEGTARLTPAQLQEELELLGTTIEITAGPEGIQMSGLTLARNLRPTMELVGEMLSRPRFDEEEFGRVKLSALSSLDQNEGFPTWIADVVFQRILCGDHVLGLPREGTRESIEAITLDEVRAFHRKFFIPEAATLAVAGALTEQEAIAAAAPLARQWRKAASPLPAPPAVPVRQFGAEVFLVDIPGAQQSQLRVGGPFAVRRHTDYYPAVVTNYPIGGNFDSRFMMILREEKGYTYGARSQIHAGRMVGQFRASTGVQLDATGESLKIMHDQLALARKGITEDELLKTKNSMSKAMTREFETLEQLLVMLRNILVYQLPADYVAQWQKTLADISAAETGRIVSTWLDPARLIFLVVGDKAAVLDQLQSLGLGPVKLLDRRGLPLPE